MGDKIRDILAPVGIVALVVGMWLAGQIIDFLEGKHYEDQE